MTEKSSNLPLLNLDNILPRADGWLRWSSWCLFGGVGLLVGLLVYFKTDQTVRSQGTIRPSAPYPAVITTQAGDLSTLYIRENEEVVTDQVLGELHSDGQIELLTAPQDGIIFQLSPDLLGKRLPAGTPITYITPRQPELTLTLQVNTQDIAQLSVGQVVQARVSAYPYPDYGILEGQIEAIAPDVTPCNTCSTSYGYAVTVALPETYLQRQQERYPLVPGMDVTADIVTQRTRLLDMVLRKLRLAADI